MNIRSIAAIFLLSLIPISTATAQNWSGFRGDSGTGQVNGTVLADADEIALNVRWKRELGSGYSSVVVSDNYVVTMYTDGTSDLAGCFSARDGEQIWSAVVGEMYKGENGSFDGPISTPLIAGDKVYCFTPAGMLYCFNLSDGTKVWSSDIADGLDAVKPMYGFATSPIMAGNSLIIQIGAEDNSLAAFDPETGEVKWSCTSDSINSQSPSVVTVDGRDIILAAGGTYLCGVDADSGDVLFEHEHGAGNGSAMVPVVFDEDKILLTTDDTHSVALSIRSSGDSYQISEEWQNNSIKNTYNVPVTHDGNLFAYSTRILTCVDQETGSAAWKSRKPGDGFLIVVDGYLIVNTKKGGLYVASADADGYEQIAGEQIFEDLVWSLPAYSNGAVFMRSLGEIACVELTGGNAEVVAAETRGNVGSELEALLTNVAVMTDEQAKSSVDEYLASKQSMPVIEGNIVEFFYQGEANDVAIACDVFGARQERRMTRIANTDTFYYAMEMPLDARANYAFLVDYKIQTDPRNSRTMTSTVYAGEMEFAVRLPGEPPLEMSWFAMPEWNAPDYLSEVDELRGELVEHELEATDEEAPPLAFSVYVPAAAGNGDNRLPAIYVFDGDNALTRGRLHELADNMGENAPVVVFLKGFGGPPFINDIANKVVPFVDENYPTIADRSGRISVGNGMAAGMGFGLLGAHPELFGSASVQTPLVFDDAVAATLEQMNSMELPCSVYIEWGRYDMFNPDENWDVRKIGKKLFDEISTSENVTVSGGEVNDSTDWSSWQNRFDRIVEMVEPADG